MIWDLEKKKKKATLKLKNCVFVGAGSVKTILHSVLFCSVQTAEQLLNEACGRLLFSQLLFSTIVSKFSN